MRWRTAWSSFDGARLVPWVVGAFVAVSTVVWAQRSGDFAGYLAVGELALAGGDIYRESPPGINTWPPFFSLLCVPLALLARPSVYLARAVWLLLNFVLLWSALRMLVGLVHGGELHLRPRAGGYSLRAPAVWLPLLLGARFTLSNFDHLQVNIVIFACALAGVYWHARGRLGRAAAALGVAAALKVMPVVFIPYFAYRRQYRMAAASAAATAAFSLLPVALYGWGRYVDYVQAWRQAIAAGWGVGKMNQSVYAMFDRYIGHGMTPFHAPAGIVVPDSGDPRVTLATCGLLALVGALALLLFRGRWRPDGPATLIEYSVVFIVSALCGPVTWKAYLVVLLLPLMLLVGLAQRGALPRVERRVVVGALAVYFASTGLTSRGILGKALADTLEMLSATTIGTLVLLATLFWLRSRSGLPVERPR